MLQPDAVAVDRYIEVRRNNLKSADAIRGELVEIQKYVPFAAWERFRKIESILDGLSSSPR